MTAPNPARLVADDEELVALLRQAEDVLLVLSDSEEYSAENDPEPWNLPAPITKRAALKALHRVWESLEAALDELRPGRPAGPRLLAPDGRYEHSPLRLAELDPVDVEILTAALGAFNQALAAGPRAAEQPRSPLSDLAELLDAIEVDPSLWPVDREPTTAADLLRPLARLVALLDMPPDDDTAALLGVLSDRGHAADVVLTPAEEAAYQRVASRLNLILADSEPLQRYQY